ncbi:MAG: SDR family oxidoreductase [Planctomycetota bacterium]
MRGLEDKRVLVTGAAKGIGEATVERFLEEGARVAVVDRDAGALDRLASRLPEIALAVDGDVSNPADVCELFSRIDELWKGIDVLVNNAGISIRRPFLETTEEDLRRVVDTNLVGLFRVAQEASRRMLAQGSGVVLNMGSMNGVVGCPEYAGYNASKAAVIELTRTMALELAPTVRVVCVCPGAVRTPMQEAEYTPEMFARLDSRIPLRRHAQPAEVAALFAFLASDEAPYFTGHPIVFDGGESAGGLASQAEDPS